MSVTGRITLVCFLLLSLILTSCNNTPIVNEANPSAPPSPQHLQTADLSGMDFTFSNRDNDPTYQAAGATAIIFSDAGTQISGGGATAIGANVMISAEGTYLLSGSAKDTTLTVNASKEAKIQLVFSNLSLSCANGPALLIQSADKVFITLAEGTQNSLSDGTSYQLTLDGTTLDAALFSKEDLTINGSGGLTVNGNYKHGIVSKDDLVITGGNLSVSAQNVGLCGKDCVKIGGGSIRVSAGSDGIRSDNEVEANRGFIYIKDGNLTVTASHDALQAQTALKIEGGVFDLTAGGGSGYTVSTESMKGLKAVSDIVISGGTFIIRSADDAIHSNNTIQIQNGAFTLSSGDDGIHADTDLSISSGTISISKSYEGIEASNIFIGGGTITLVASDDGLNAAGGNDASSTSGRPGQGAFTMSTGSITISGGYLLVNAAGDGIDSNGSITVTGGITLVSGPTNSGNGALDYDTTATVTGGVFIALGASGMAQSLSVAEGQGAIYQSFSTQSAGTPISLCDTDGNVIVSFAPQKAYQCAVISAPTVQSGNTYTLVVGGTVAEADANGYAQSTSLSGGTLLSTVQMTSNLYGFAGGMGGGPSGGGGPGGPGGGTPPSPPPGGRY